MKCSKCNSENIIELKTLKLDEHNITFFACKDCCNVDLYCLDFKKKNELIEKVNKILDNILNYRKKYCDNKLKALNSLLNLIDKNNNIYSLINENINELNNYLNVNNLLSIKEENGYDDKGNIVKKTVYYIEDFPINYNDCTNGHNGLFFYLSKEKYKNLESVKHHKINTTVLDILDEYYLKEALNHKYLNLTNLINNLSFKEKNEILELYNK